MKPSQRKPLDFPYALRSFLGYLEGTEKSAHTIKNYKLDLLSFERFLSQKHSPKLSLGQLTLSDLRRFDDFLKSENLKTNTRRRKLITVKRFLNYLAERKKVPAELLGKLLTPGKVERFPRVVPYSELLDAVRAISPDDSITERNRVLLWTLAETGCLVSEVAQVQFENWTPTGIRFEGKSARTVPISNDLYQAGVELKKKHAHKRSWMFPGQNRFGELGGPISPRGIEMMVKHYQPLLGLGRISPRIIRHSVTREWFQKSMSRDEIKKRLGLKSEYAFRAHPVKI